MRRILLKALVVTPPVFLSRLLGSGDVVRGVVQPLGGIVERCIFSFALKTMSLGCVEPRSLGGGHVMMDACWMVVHRQAGEDHANLYSKDELLVNGNASRTIF
jgi:hypothetical protein